MCICLFIYLFMFDNTMYYVYINSIINIDCLLRRRLGRGLGRRLGWCLYTATINSSIISIVNITYIYIYIYRERERLCIIIYIYIYRYIYIYIYM